MQYAGWNKGDRRIWQIAMFSFGSRLFCPQCQPPDRLWNSILFICIAYPYQNLTIVTSYLSTNYLIKVIFCSWFFPSAYRQCTVYQSFIVALYYCKLFGIKIYVLCLSYICKYTYTHNHHIERLEM